MKRILFAVVVLIAINATSYGQTTAKAKDAHKAVPAQKAVKAGAVKTSPDAAVTSVSPEKKDAAVPDKKHITHKKKEKAKSKK